MPNFMLTSSNLHVLKTALQSRFSIQSAAVLNDVLAVGVGCATYDALLKVLDCQPEGKAEIVNLNLERMARRLNELAGVKPDLQFLAEFVRSPKLPERIWVAYKTGDAAANAAWYYECRRRSVPMVFLETRNKYIRLNWDCITIDASEDAHVHRQAGKDLGSYMFTIFQNMTKGAPGKPFFDASAMTGHVDRLLPDTAYAMADIFFRLLYEPIKSNAKAA